MKSIAVVYRSKYGSTRQYAQWIAKALNCELFEWSDIKPADLKEYDIVVYGGGLYAGGILGIEQLTKQTLKKLVVFTNGLTKSEAFDYAGTVNKNLPPKQRAKVKLFYFRGAIDYSRLTPVHAGMMTLRKRMIEKKDSITQTDSVILQTYGSSVSFVERDAIEPLVSFVINIRL